MPPKLVIFDCDGVLVDTEAVANRVLADILIADGLAITPNECRVRYVGLTLGAVRDDVERRTGRKLPADWIEGVHARTYEAFRDGIEPVAGVRDVLLALRDRGVATCVASSGRIEKMHLTLGLTGLLPLVEHVLFSSTMVARGKPFPDLFLFAAKEMGATPATSVVVEDSVPGVTAARAADMRVLAYVGDPLTQRERVIAAGGEPFEAMHELPLLFGL